MALKLDDPPNHLEGCIPGWQTLPRASDSVGLGTAQESAFLTTAQVMLVWGGTFRPTGSETQLRKSE